MNENKLALHASITLAALRKKKAMVSVKRLGKPATIRNAKEITP